MNDRLPTPFFSDEEIAEMCAPLVMPGAQCRHLARMGLFFSRKPNGRPLLARSEYERVQGAARFGKAQNEASAGPNFVGLMNHLAKRKPNGTTAKRR